MTQHCSPAELVVAFDDLKQLSHTIMELRDVAGQVLDAIRDADARPILLAAEVAGSSACMHLLTAARELRHARLLYQATQSQNREINVKDNN
jgi:hypothetical protein